MEMSGEQTILRPQAVTWSSITDPRVLKACIPGCESMDKVGDNEYELVMGAKVGPVSAKFKGKITLADVDAPHAYTLIFEGQGGVAGFAKGQANVRLLPDGETTRLQYTAKAMIGGKLAQVGSRLVDGVARKMAESFFSAFNEHVSGVKGEG
ncbi:MAG: carbon monoxide dehydrogenase subunit G [Betaproteobacteria bacterium]|nr:carbon monoxide dehydrogenase subunit G [Betaproteobacteria bacterium]